jgi:hypothetical protein
MANAVAHYNKGDLIILDGEDHANVLDIAERSTYYKRELVKAFENVSRPISFSYPSYYAPKIEVVKPKKQFLAPCVAGMRSSYNFSTEDSYYSQYSASIFGLTTKKAGWDCMRHYEIINAGCIPYFPDIKNKPATTMFDYPMELQNYANDLFEICLKDPSLIENKFKNEIEAVVEAFAGWFKACGTSSKYQAILR